MLERGSIPNESHTDAYNGAELWAAELLSILHPSVSRTPGTLRQEGCVKITNQSLVLFIYKAMCLIVRLFVIALFTKSFHVRSFEQVFRCNRRSHCRGNAKEDNVRIGYQIEST